MMVMNIPLTEEGADTLYNQIKCEYGVHNMSISIFASHIQMVIYDDMERDNIKYDELRGYITITQSDFVSMSAVLDGGVCALEIMKLILELIIKLEED